LTAERSLRVVADSEEGHGIEIAGITDKGPVREENQDVWDAAARPEDGGWALLLADGMGGHNGGRESAEAAVVAAAKQLREPGPASELLVAAVDDATAAVAGVRAQLGGHPGTTLVLALIEGQRALIANVGDSRAYRIRHGEATQLTEDHSWVGEQIREGHLDPAEARHHPRRNIITRAVMGDPVAGDQFTVVLQSRDVVLLCSDGVWEPLDDSALGALFADHPPLPPALEWLCDAALAAGGTDNITAVAARLA
jgi:serine/threonine protein phosphatase PrpC